MALLQWKDEYRTGHASIDYEHEHLISSINVLYGEAEGGAGTDAALVALGEIHALIEAHFALEEKIMRDHRYADYIAHKDDHDRLLDDIRDIMDDVQRQGGGVPGVELGRRLSGWFGAHFATLDKDLHSKLGH